MPNQEIIKNLKILGITFQQQLIDNDLNFWHQKIYRKNIRNEKKLIQINAAKEYLNNFSSEDLKIVLGSANNENEEKQKETTNPDNNSNDFLNKQEKRKGETFLERQKRLKDEQNNEESKNINKKDLGNKKSELVSLMYAEGEKLFLEGEYQKAIKFYSSVIDSEQFKYLDKYTRRDTFNERAHSYKALGNFLPAYNDYNSAIEIDPNNGCLYLYRGKLLHDEKKFKEAINDFNQAIYLNDREDFYYYRGLSKKGLLEYEEAIKDFTTAIEKYDESYSFERKVDIEEFHSIRRETLDLIIDNKDETDKDLTYRGVSYKENQSSSNENQSASSNDLEGCGRGCGMFLYFAFSGLLLIALPGLGIIMIIAGFFLFKK